MGKFKIEIFGDGDHGVDRAKEDGETVNFLEGGDTTVDAIARETTKHVGSRFEQRGIKLLEANLIHFPSEDDEYSIVIDNLSTGIRTGSFNKFDKISDLPVQDLEKEYLKNEIENQKLIIAALEEEIRYRSVDKNYLPVTEEAVVELVLDAQKTIDVPEYQASEVEQNPSNSTETTEKFDS